MSQHPNTAQKAHAFVWLDALRGVAALIVVSNHVIDTTDSLAPINLRNASLAVDLFFLLSGFVLAHAYTRRLEAGMTAVAFLRIRLTRLFPLYLLGTVLGILIAVVSLEILHRKENFLSARDLLEAAALALAMLPSFGLSMQGLVFPFNAPAWSLFFELLVNIPFALFWLRLQTRPAVMAGILVASLALLVVAAKEFGVIGLGWAPANFWVGFPRTVFSFFLGLVVFRIHLRWPRQIPAVLGLFLLLALPLVLAPRFDGVFDAGYQLLLVMTVFPLLVYGLAGVQVPPRLVPCLGFLGRVSFPLYAVHYPFLVAVRGVGIVTHIELKALAPAAGLLQILFVLVMAALVDRYFDQPVQRWLKGSGSGASR